MTEKKKVYVSVEILMGDGNEIRIEVVEDVMDQFHDSLIYHIEKNKMFFAEEFNPTIHINGQEKSMHWINTKNIVSIW